MPAAYERACQDGGKKCIRGVVADDKLIPRNPWKNFTWIEGKKKKLRQFDHDELLSLLDYFSTNWEGLVFAPAFLKVCLWSWARRLEVSSLRWSKMRQINDEFHFESTGKWGVTKWFRIPERLCADLESFRTSDFVFGSYPQQLRRFLDLRGDKKTASRVREDFAPENLGEWMYRQIADWSKSQTNGPAYLHIFRKTALQYAVTAGHVEQSVADDASVTSSVLMKNYASNGDEEFRQMSNRTYRRIRSSLSVEVATRYGWNANPEDGIVEKLDQARNRKDWEAISQLAQELNRLKDQKSDS